MHEKSKKLWKIEKVKKGLTDYINYKEIKKKEVDGTQRSTRDQRQRAGSYEVRKKELKNEGCEHRKKGSVKTKIIMQFF